MFSCSEIHGQRVDALKGSREHGVSDNIVKYFYYGMPAALLYAVPTFRGIAGNVFMSVIHIFAAILPIVAGGIWWKSKTMVAGHEPVPDFGVWGLGLGAWRSN